MFKKSRSKRANKQAATPVQVPPTAAAAIAAMQAANGNTQEGKLAAGAAAAALRSHTPPPINVASVQTKRTLRRASVTSASSDTSYAHGQMRMSRSGSISSMTSRTFRSPSPHGGKPELNGATPPVPSLPASASTPSSMSSRLFRRPASTEPTARVTSPGPYRGTRNMSVDAVTRRKPAAIDTSNLRDVERNNGSRNSVNFSRPMSPENRPLSPSPTSPTARARAGYTDSSYESDELVRHYQDVANKPVKKTKGLGGDEGSHLAAGTMGVRAHGSAVSSPPVRPKRIPLPRRISEEPDDDEEEFEQVYDPHTRTMVTRRKPGFKPKARGLNATAESPASKPAASTQVRSPARSPARSQPSTAASPAVPLPQPKTREASVSPARKAYTSLKPEEPTMHEPDRSLTPTKSALRKSPTPRGMSPADTGSKRVSWNQPGFTPSEASETPSLLSEERSKRKSVRVSFDERPTIVGTSATQPDGTDTPVILSPQNDKKKSWFGLRKNKAHSDATEDEEDRMGPMPALPSFGSVRGKRMSPEDDQPPTTGVLGIPGVAITTGENTPSEAGSHAEETSTREDIQQSQEAPESQETHTNGSIKKLKSGDVPMIAVIPGTPGVEKSLEDVLDQGVEENSSPVADTSPAALGIAEPEPELAAAAHDPDTPAVGHVAEAMHKQAEAPEALESDSQDSHYSDAAEDVDGDGFGSINAIVESPVVGPDSPQRRLSEALPPLTEEPPKEISPVPAAEADTKVSARDEVNTDKQVNATSKVGPDSESNQKTDSERTNGSKPAATKVKSPVESITYNPRRAGSTSSSSDISPGAPKRFAARDALQPSLDRSGSYESNERESKRLSQTGPYPRFERSPRRSLMEDSDDSSLDDPRPAVPPKSAARGTAASPETTSTASPPARAGTEKKPLKSALKQTNRVSMPAEVLPAAQPRGALQKKQRPLSAAPAPPPAQQSEAVMLAKAMIKVQERRAKEAKATEADVEATGERARNAAIGGGGMSVARRNTQTSVLSKTRRRGSDASDSSFKRGPSSVASDGGRVTMRRSMRAGTSSRPQSMVGGGSFRQNAPDSGRSRPMSTAGGFSSGSMRQPSRDASPSRSLVSFGKSKRMSAQPSGSRRNRVSRLDDSSDDDDEPVMARQSRFEQRSSAMRPARSIPQRTEEVDSSDLESIDAVSLPPPRTAPMHDTDLMELARQRLGIEARPAVPEVNEEEHGRVSQGDLAAAFAEKSALAEKPKRRSIFGSLARRKNHSKVGKDTEDSIARRDTPLERSALQRKTTVSPSAGTTTSRPGYSRQNTEERVAALRDQVDPDSWPLPESPTAATRPDTSDGSPQDDTPRRPLNVRQFSSESAPVFGRSGKKKRFPFLRRAFGLHD